jgi:hypothetical protein
MKIFYKLLTNEKSDHIFLSDVYNIIKSMEEDFPKLCQVSSIGESWEKRDIHLLSINYNNDIDQEENYLNLI